MGSLGWLFERPIAHRGLHDRAAGVVENTASAVARAVEHGYAVEIDVRETRDGEAAVFHDATLSRLTGAEGRVAERTMAELRTLELKGAGDRIWALQDCLDLVAGRVALVVEIKAPWGVEPSFARRVAGIVAARDAAIAVKSFNPHAVRAVRAAAPQLARGVIGEAFADHDPTWRRLGARRRASARDIRHMRFTKPDFLSWDIEDLSRPAVVTARAAGLPVMAWTVRDAGQQRRAAHSADQIVFERFLPAAQNR